MEEMSDDFWKLYVVLTVVFVFSFADEFSWVL
jgi:hypothetical protein